MRFKEWNRRRPDMPYGSSGHSRAAPRPAQIKAPRPYLRGRGTFDDQHRVRPAEGK
jgi:hypothetical protein